MQKIDPAFLFENGSTLRRVRTIDTNTSYPLAYVFLDQAKTAIEQLIDQSVYAHLVRVPCRTAANKLLEHMANLSAKMLKTENWDDGRLAGYETTTLQALYNKFETLMIAELQGGALYLVSPKAGFNTDALIESGFEIFSADLGTKVPDAILDIMQATRCIAFELPTAAGFHLHRAHESVLKAYWDSVTGGAERPKDNSMGVYLRELDKLKKGKESVRSHLRSIKDFHRNPLMHPEQSLEGVDQAVDLLSAIRCSIGYMLPEIGMAAPLLEQMEAPALVRMNDNANAAE